MKANPGTCGREKFCVTPTKTFLAPIVPVEA